MRFSEGIMIGSNLRSYKSGLVVLLLLAALIGLSRFSAAQVIRSGSRACKAIALTFDLCPVRDGRGYDEALVRMLVEKRIPATFFLSGRWMAKHESEVESLLAVPFFEIGTHGQLHAHLPELDEEHQRMEIQGPVALLGVRYGRRAPLFRPPYGEYNDATISLTKTLGLRFILWDIVSGDPDPGLPKERILRTIRSKVRNGSIVVLHANGKGRYTREIVDDLYRDLIVKQGLRPVTVSTLLDRCDSAPHHEHPQANH